MPLAIDRNRAIIDAATAGTIPTVTTRPLPGLPPTALETVPVVWTPTAPVDGSTPHFADVAMADAWIDDAASRATDAVRASIDATTDEASQENAVLALWESISRVYRALNIPPTICPVYRSQYFDWIGRAYTPGPHAIDMALAHRIGNLYADPLPITTVSGQRIRNIVGRADAYSIKMPVRVNLDQDALVVSQCMGGPAATWNDLCNATEAGDRGTTLWFPPITTPGNAPWNTLRTDYVPDPAGFGNNQLYATPPARWFFEMGALWVQELARQRAATVLRNALANQTLLNAAAAAANAPPGMPPEAQAELQRQAATLPADFEHLKWHNAGRSTIDTFLTTASTILHLIPVYGTLAAGIVMGIKALIDSLPTPVAVAGDPWGRGVPIYEYSFISVSGLRGAPNYSLQGPMGWRRPPPGTPPRQPVSPPMSNGTKTALAVAGVGLAAFGANALGLIDLGKLGRKK